MNKTARKQPKDHFISACVYIMDSMMNLLKMLEVPSSQGVLIEDVYKTGKDLQNIESIKSTILTPVWGRFFAKNDMKSLQDEQLFKWQNA